MSTVYLTSFTADLAASLAYADEDARLLTDALSDMYRIPPHRVAVTKTPPELDRQGIDYVVRVLGGAASEGTAETVTVDMKRTAAGKARYWRSEDDPNVIIEVWSVAPTKEQSGVPGPLFRAGPLPSYWGLAYGDLPGKLYLLPADALRQAAQRYREAWTDAYKLHYPAPTAWGSEGRSYVSAFVPVPLSAVQEALREISHSEK